MPTPKSVKENPFLEKYGIKTNKIHYQLAPQELQQITVENGQGRETSNGVLAVETGKFTGRSPKDRFIVKDDVTDDRVWWGEINIPFSPEKFEALYDKMTDYLSGKAIYVRDAYACADERYRQNIRAINEYPWSNLFVYNMFLRPADDELADFKEDWLILNAPGFEADPEVDGTRQGNFSILNLKQKIALIGGSAYTGEIKKGLFSALNFTMPVFHNTLPMHSSANVGRDGKTAIFFGLSGTGKTTLSADPERKLIGDDEHGWTPDDTVFNFEGGCYAKAVDLSEEEEPDIYKAVKPGALLENVVLNAEGEVDFTDTSITKNTRVSYPINYIKNIQKPSLGRNPRNIFFLTADAFGVLPPISKLTPGQAAYHFISGYTAKVAGTEAGVDEPVPSFSACFGAPFMLLHPTRYAEMLSQKMKASGVNVWLVNTGWTGGAYGTGKRINLKYTRAMIAAALSGQLDKVDYESHQIFGLQMPTTCPHVPSKVLSPEKTWDDAAAYERQAEELCGFFRENFKAFKTYANDEILAGQIG